MIAYSYKDDSCSNNESIFVGIYLPKSKPVTLGISYRSPGKSDFVKRINDVFTETRISDKSQWGIIELGISGHDLI